MHWTARLFWALTRLLPKAQRPMWDPIPTAQSRVGPQWLTEWSELRGEPLRQSHDGGLIPDLECWTFDEPLDPAILAFYKHSLRQPLWTRSRWSWPLSLVMHPLNRWIGACWGQLLLPGAIDHALPSTLWCVGQQTWWRRAYGSSPEQDVFLLCEYRTDAARRTVRISFPVPGGALVAVLGLRAQQGALHLDMRGARNGGLGMYLVPHEGVARYVPLQRESLHVRASPGGAITTDHTFALLGWVYLRMTHQSGDGTSSGVSAASDVRLAQ